MILYVLYIHDHTVRTYSTYCILEFVCAENIFTKMSGNFTEKMCAMRKFLQKFLTIIITFAKNSLVNNIPKIFPYTQDHTGILI